MGDLTCGVKGVKWKALGRSFTKFTRLNSALKSILSAAGASKFPAQKKK